MQSDFDILEEEMVFSNAKGRRRECKAQGFKSGTSAFRDCLKGMRQEDKGKTPAEKRAEKKERKAHFKDAIAEGQIKRTFFGRAFKGVKKVVMAPMRNAFNVILSLNVWDMTAKLGKLKDLSETDPAAKKAWNKAVAAWIQTGGSKKVFLKAVDRGRGKRPIIIRFRRKMETTGFDGFTHFTGVEEATAAAATSTPLIVTISEILSGVATIVGGLNMTKESKDEIDAEFNENPDAYTVTDEDVADAEKQIIKGISNATVFGIGFTVVGIIVVIAAIAAARRK